MEQLDCVRARVHYIHPNIRPDADPEGMVGLFQAGWLMADDEAFPGRWAMIPAAGGYWIPDDELVDIMPIDSAEYYAYRERPT